MALSRPLASVLVLLLSLAAPALSSPAHNHNDAISRALPDTWYHARDHPANSLFRRDNVSTDGQTYADIGTPAWSAGFPVGAPNPAKLPSDWVAALNAAVAAGKIPNSPVSTSTSGASPTYPGGSDPMSKNICSATYKCRNLDYDIWDAPDGVVGIGFDDGPLPASQALYQFLQSQNQRATHFMIGTNILNNPNEFKFAFEVLQDDIAVHTWTHPYMTTLSNTAVLGELGWTMQLIYNSTGGRLPRYWRPPYGDADNRVRAIAKEVFGLTTLIWNQDTDDWSIGQPGGTTATAASNNMKKWLTGPKSPGLVILEHELTKASVDVFIQAYPMISSNGWKSVSQAVMDGGSGYANANSTSSSSNITHGGLLAGGAISNSTIAPPSSSTEQSSKTGTAGAAAASSSSNGGSERWTLLRGWAWLTAGVAAGASMLFL